MANRSLQQLTNMGQHLGAHRGVGKLVIEPLVGEEFNILTFALQRGRHFLRLLEPDVRIHIAMDEKHVYVPETWVTKRS